MARLIHFFPFIYKCLLSIFDAPGIVFPDGGPRRGLCLAGLMVLEVYHRLAECLPDLRQGQLWDD